MSRPTLTTEQYRTAYYELGWDCGRHELYLPAQQLTDLMEHRDRFLQGFDEATKRFRGRYAPYDPFELKVLRIRLNALRRKRIYLDNVDANYLREIAQLRCPVTLKPMAFFADHALDLYPNDEIQRKDMIWSVDRVDNRGGYERGNLMIISAKVNEAKGNMGLEDILNVAVSLQKASAGATHHGLDCDEWCRLAYLCSSMTCEVDWQTHTLFPAQTFWGNGVNFCFPLEALKYGFVTHLTYHGFNGTPHIEKLFKSLFVGKTAKVAQKFGDDVSTRLQLSPYAREHHFMRMHSAELSQLRFAWLWNDPYTMDRWKHLINRLSDADVDRVRVHVGSIVGRKYLSTQGFEANIGLKYSKRDDAGYFSVSDESEQPCLA